LITNQFLIVYESVVSLFIQQMANSQCWIGYLCIN